MEPNGNSATFNVSPPNATTQQQNLSSNNQSTSAGEERMQIAPEPNNLFAAQPPTLGEENSNASLAGGRGDLVTDTDEELPHISLQQRRTSQGVNSF